MKIRAMLAVLGAVLASVCHAQAALQSEAGVPLLTLSNGVKMPQLGIGTFGTPNQTAPGVISFAVQNGYRHIDGAHAYFNEEGVGKGIRQSGVARERIWLTSKLWATDYTNTDPDAAIDQMLKRFGVEYLDLLYIHQPVGDYKAAYAAMIRAYKAGKVRALGISNFDYDDPRVKSALDWFLNEAEIRPHVMQIQCHPYAQRSNMRKLLSEKGVQLEAWFPLGGAMSKGLILRDSVIGKIAKAHGKSPAQVIIRWHLQEGFSVIPGAMREDYIKENIDVFDFALSQAEMDAIRALNQERKTYNPTYEQTVRFVNGMKP